MSVFHSSSCCDSSTFCWIASISCEFTCGAKEMETGEIFSHLTAPNDPSAPPPRNQARLSRPESPLGERGRRPPLFANVSRDYENDVADGGRREWKVEGETRRGKLPKYFMF